MALMLGRPIVVQSVDGIFGVYPEGYSGNEGLASEGPLAINHCAAANITESVSFGSRNHYIPGGFPDHVDELVLSNAARDWRGFDMADGADGTLASHPRLALPYYHCCSADPDACVFNDESLEGEAGEATVERLMQVLDNPVSAGDIHRCQERVAKSSGESGDLWACASCCEILNTVEDSVAFIPREGLHPHFLLTGDEMEAVSGLGAGVIDNHIQVFRSGALMYHLNPDLVRDPGSIPLCVKCAEDPRKSKYSIASGHDYGPVGCFPELNDVASKCIAPVRSFGLAITASDNDIRIDESAEARQALVELEERIEASVEIMTSEQAGRVDDGMMAEHYGDDGENSLKSVDAFDLSVTNAAVDATLSMLGREDGGNGDTESGVEDGTAPVVVRRGADPVTEWTENGEMIAAAFPQLFMRGGKFLPCGTWPASLTRHLMRYYDGRFEKDTRLVATLFNQLQRHTSVRRAARIGSSRASVLTRLGSLSNSEEFKALLIRSQQNPESREAKRVTNERNQLTSVFGRKECCRNDLPENVRSSARRRLIISNAFPGLVARAFERRVRQIYNDIILCKRSVDTRISRDYLQRCPGAYGTVAAHAAVVEPHADGRLHIDMCVYGSKLSPGLLSRIACSERLCRRAADWLESVCCTGFDQSVHEWRQRCKADGGVPKAFEIAVPDALDDPAGILLAAQKVASVTNFHSHTSTCLKGIRGKYECRLSRPAGVHDRGTCPLIVTRERVGDMAAGVYPIVTGHNLPPHICEGIDAGYSTEKGQCFRSHDEGPVVWELKRAQMDASVVETNLVLATLTVSHTNSSVINGESSGDMVEEYQEAYMAKNQIALKGAATALLGAIEYENKFPSRAEDSKSNLRIGKYLAARTVNSFFGAHEWSHALMVYAITGYRSFISSDAFGISFRSLYWRL
ncbi:hypothetical protein PHYSODRAFT_306172 [Phytophthora sojae]|uniref:Helitron helicase-like domain-containing protein n=1 Tax=Phytophthora sojae (strain P6497) TaxID=1094619 RepID=G5A875_PHYSP|nr:hypothetical protein PHYSODRAFT_306172 [Phytophthora sojae]EGZ08101.1 hypothetical protein PHYSODRAFT_306172 [Phytophthora sojae]|eukprot:XP_009536273.1 hypothetical protein PHYSODRAFT_306172 [Phytophthora sojae]